jgi:hypothetical protein
MAGARNISYLFTRLHDAFSAGGVTPPRLEINRRTIEKTWKLMDKAGLSVGVSSLFRRLGGQLRRPGAKLCVRLSVL